MSSKIVKFEKNKRPVFSGLKDGFFSVFESFKFMRENKGFPKFFIIPFLLNLILLSFLVFAAWQYLYPYLLSNIPAGNEWYIVFIQRIASFLFLVVSSAVVLLLYSITGSILSAVFYDFISEKTEVIITGEQLDEPFSFKLMLEDMKRIIFNVLKMIVFLLLINGVLFFINFIPFVGSFIYTVLSFLTVSFFFGFQFFEFTLDRKRLTFGQKLRITFKYKWLTCGTGVAFMLLTFIPVIGFLSIGAGVTAGTILYFEKIHPFINYENRS